MEAGTIYSHLSAGVYIQEIDLSVRVQLATAAVGGIVGESARGPLDVRYSTTGKEWLALYGKPRPSVSFMHDCALPFIEESGALWTKRVVNGALHAGHTYYIDAYSKAAVDATKPRLLSRQFPLGSAKGAPNGPRVFHLLSFAGLLVTANQFSMTVTDGVTSVTIGPITYATSHNNTLSLIAAAIQTAMNTFSSGGLAAVIAEPGINANNWMIGIHPPSNVTLDFDLGNTPITSGASQTTVALDEQPTFMDVFAENPGLWGNNIGTKITNVDQGIRARWRLTFSNALVASNVVTLTLDDNQTVSTTYSNSSDETLANLRTALLAYSNISDVIIDVVAGATNNDRSMTIVAKHPGPDTFSIKAAVVTAGASQAAILIQETLKGVASTNEFDLEVYDRANVVVPIERFRVTTRSYVNGFGSQMLAEKVVNNLGSGSLNVRVLVPQTTNTAASKAREVSSLVNGVWVVDTVIRWLNGGDDGVKALNSQIAAAWPETFSNREVVTARLFINGGYSDIAVQQSMVALAEKRFDGFAILDMPSDKQAPQSAFTHRMQNLNIDSSYGAVYSPDLRVRDEDSDEDRYIPPSGHVAASYAYTQRVGALWKAPAGLNRGKIKKALGLRYDYDKGHQELLDPVQINCIVHKSGVGPTIWAEETLQRKKSVLSSVHARLLLNALEVGYADALERGVLFDPNNAFTRYQAEQIGMTILEPVKAEGGLYSYEIVVDERNNTPEVIDQDALRVDIYLKIVRTAKRILLRAILLRTGADFSEEIELVNNNNAGAAAA